MATPNITTTAHTGEEQISGMDAAERERLDELEALTGTREDGGEQRIEGEIDDGQPRQVEEVVDKPIPMSPADAERARIASRFKRDDGAPFDGDMTKDENLYGDVARVTETPDPALPDPGAAANGDGSEPTTPEPTFTFKVRGKDVTMTQAELIAAASKVEAADSYLAETRDLLKAAKEVKAGRVAPDSQHPEDGEHNEQDDDTSAPRRPGDKRKEAIAKIQFGDPDEAEAALAEYVGETVTSAIEEGQTKRLKDNDLVTSQRALQTFIKENPTLAASKEASQLIENGVYEVYREELIGLGLADEVVPRNPKDIAEWARHYRIQGHPVSSAVDVLNKAKERILPVLNPALLGQPAPKPRTASPNVEVNVDRTQRRTAIPNQPSRAVAPRPNPTQAQQPKSRSDVVAEMRKARGQPV